MIGNQVHYVWTDGEHKDATITNVLHEGNGVVDLSVVYSEEVPDHKVLTVIYSSTPVPFTWHWKKDDKES